jgi:hypothetical protein
MGRTCAVKAGLLPASLFTRRRSKAQRKPRAPRSTGQLEIVT